MSRSDLESRHYRDAASVLTVSTVIHQISTASPEPSPTTSTRQKAHPGAVILTVVVGGVLPVLVGLALLVSSAVHRPLLQRSPRWWWNPVGSRHDDLTPAFIDRVTARWGWGFLIVGALQGASALLGLSITSPRDALIRTTGAVVLEIAFMAPTLRRLWRKAKA